MSSRSLHIVCLAVLSLVLAYGFYATAWVVDDAYITFRTVDNFVNGHGLTWNVSERVQAYSHPLWMFLISLCFLFTSELFYTSLALSFALCAALVLVVHRYFSGDEQRWKAPVFVVLLVSSKAFMDYASSGLENPLSHLLVALFYARLATGDRPLAELPRRDVCWLFFLAALAFVNRMDTVLFYAPTVAWLMVVHVRRRGLRFAGALLLALSPALLWLLFSTVYYGFPFPNTAYAKASHIGVSLGDRVARGWAYLTTGVVWDAAGFAMIALAAGLAVWRRQGRALLAVAGVLLYLAYVVTTAASATHMAGRFFSVALVVAFLVALDLLRHRAALGAVAAGAVVFTLISPVAPLKMNTSLYVKQPMDRSCLDTNWYVHQEGAALVNHTAGRSLPAHQWYLAGKAYREHPSTLHVGGVYGQAIGYFGQAAGPRKHIIDNLGLADAFLARLPACNTGSPDYWKSGHFYRLIPPGYVASVKYNRNLMRHASLRQYLDRINSVTRGPVWSWQRFVDIFQLNTGAHDHLLVPYQRLVLQRYATRSCKDDVYRAGVGAVR